MIRETAIVATLCAAIFFPTAAFAEGLESPEPVPVPSVTPSAVPSTAPSATPIVTPEPSATPAPEPEPEVTWAACGPVGSCGEVPTYVQETPMPAPVSEPAVPAEPAEPAVRTEPTEPAMLAETGPSVNVMLALFSLVVFGLGAALAMMARGSKS